MQGKAHSRSRTLDLGGGKLDTFGGGLAGCGIVAGHRIVEASDESELEGVANSGRDRVGSEGQAALANVDGVGDGADRRNKGEEETHSEKI